MGLSAVPCAASRAGASQCPRPSCHTPPPTPIPPVLPLRPEGVLNARHWTAAVPSAGPVSCPPPHPHTHRSKCPPTSDP